MISIGAYCFYRQVYSEKSSDLLLIKTRLMILKEKQTRIIADYIGLESSIIGITQNALHILRNQNKSIHSPQMSH